MKNSLLRTLLIFSTVVSNSSQAYDGKLLEKGTEAPFQGVLFNITDANKIRVELLEKDTLVFLTESYKRSLDLTDKNMKFKDEQLDIVISRNLDLTKALNSQKSMNDWERVLWFGLGIAVSTLTLYGLKHVSR